MLISKLSDYLQKLDKTSSRIEITKILAELFTECSVDEIEKVTYLILGTIAPRYKNIVFNIADRMMVRAIAKAYEGEIEDVQALYKKIGDLGKVASDYAKDNNLNDKNKKLVSTAKAAAMPELPSACPAIPDG